MTFLFYCLCIMLLKVFLCKAAYKSVDLCSSSYRCSLNFVTGIGIHIKQPGWSIDFMLTCCYTLLFTIQGEKVKTLSLRTKPDNILEGQEKFRVSLITADNNADISHTQGDAQIIVLPDPGASGTVSIVPEQRTVYIGKWIID